MTVWNAKRLLALGLKLKAHTPLFPYTKVVAVGKDFLHKGKTATLEPGKPSRRHVQSFMAVGDPDAPLSKAKAIKVHCTCKDWQMRYQWVMNKEGAAFGPPAVNEPPVQTNPSMSPGVCRHITVALVRILRNGR